MFIIFFEKTSSYDIVNNNLQINLLQHPDQYVPNSCCKLNNVKHVDFNITYANMINGTLCQQEFLEINDTGHNFEYLNNKVIFGGYFVIITIY